MPSPMYFHPFMDPRHNTGCFLGSWPSALSLHFVAPTFGRKHFCYLREMGANSTTFQHYTSAAHRIYVMGHGNPGNSYLTTETGTYESCGADELAVHFVRHGLPPNSAVQIRIHACHSATPSAQNAADSFAEQFLAEMRNARTGNGGFTNARMNGVQFPNVTVRGYDRAVGVYLGQRWAGFQPANDYAVDFQ